MSKICLSCGKLVEVHLVRYGHCWIAVCPDCGKLAANEGQK